MPGIELHQALTACEAFLESHGGHGAAAGFKIRPERIAAFRDCFNAFVSKRLTTNSRGHTLTIDAEIPLAAVTINLVKELNKLEPFGSGNSEPILLASGVKVESLRAIGKDEPRRHVSFYARQRQTQCRCVAWNMMDRFEELSNPTGHYAVAFTPRIDEWNGDRRVTLVVKDFQASDPGKT
jgi:single-stranded-DNA-specific exonuclease